MKTATLSLFFLLLGVVASAVGLSEALSLNKYVEDTKNHVWNSIKNGLLSRNSGIAAFNESVHQIHDRYEKLLAEGQLDNKERGERSELLYKIVIEELHGLRKSLGLADQGPAEAAAGQETVTAYDAGAEVGRKDESRVLDKSASSLDRVPLNSDSHEDMGFDGAKANDDDELMNELDSLDSLNRILKQEKELGWRMRPEDRAELRTQTLFLLGDLLQNELRNLAICIVNGYLINLSGGTILGGAFSVSLVHKLVEFFMHSVGELFAKPMEQATAALQQATHTSQTSSEPAS